MSSRVDKMRRDLRSVIQSFQYDDVAEVAQVSRVEKVAKNGLLRAAKSRDIAVEKGGDGSEARESNSSAHGEKIDKLSVKSRKSIKRSGKSKVRSTNSIQNYDSLLDLQPMISSDISLLFVGFNPGVESSRQQHHYAHPTNLFWKLFNALDVLTKVLDFRREKLNGGRSMDDDVFLNLIFQNGKLTATAQNDNQLVSYGVGFTDLVLRCTKTAQELSRQEKLDNVPRLFSEFAQSNAKWIVVIGKGIWEFIVKYVNPSFKLTKETFQWGLQKGLLVKEIHRQCGTEFGIYVFPNTSGLVALMKYQDKLALWEDLAGSIN